MLTFFRRIRKSLLGSGQARKYLLYAIGEIALVVIGILIALQINNWNENRKTNSLDQEFLHNLEQELIQDTITFSERKESYSNINHLLTQSIKLLSSDQSLNNDQMDTVKRSIGMVEILTPLYKNINRNNAELANGRLERISSDLNNLYNNYIEQYQSDFEVSSKFGETLHKMSVENLYPFVEYQHAYLTRANFNIEELQNNSRVLNMYHRSVGWRNVYLVRLEDRIENVKALLMLIDDLKKY